MRFSQFIMQYAFHNLFLKATPSGSENYQDMPNPYIIVRPYRVIYTSLKEMSWASNPFKSDLVAKVVVLQTEG